MGDLPHQVAIEIGHMTNFNNDVFCFVFFLIFSERPRLQINEFMRLKINSVARNCGDIFWVKSGSW